MVRQAAESDVSEVVDYLCRNRSFHAPVDPIRADEYFTAEHWEKRIEYAIEDFNKGRYLELFVFEINMPNRIIGKITFNNLVRGAFQACVVGYAMCESALRKGYMTEALGAAIKHMFDIENYHRIMANYMPRNFASAALLNKLGFTLEGTAKDYLLIAGSWEDHILTSLTNPDWRPK